MGFRERTWEISQLQTKKQAVHDVKIGDRNWIPNTLNIKKDMIGLVRKDLVPSSFIMKNGWPGQDWQATGPLEAQRPKVRPPEWLLIQFLCSSLSAKKKQTNLPLLNGLARPHLLLPLFFLEVLWFVKLFLEVLRNNWDLGEIGLAHGEQIFSNFQFF